MFEENLSRIIDVQSENILEGKADISFQEFTAQPLPTHAGYYLVFLLQPKLGGKVKIGDTELDFTEKKLDTNSAYHLKETCRINVDGMKSLLFESLKFRTNFILNPSEALSKLIYTRAGSDSLKATDLSSALDGMMKLFEKWDPNLAGALKEIRTYYSHQGDTLIKESDCTRVLGSAVEKVMSVEQGMLENLLRELERIVVEDPEKEEVAKVDFTQAAEQVLSSCGYFGYLPAIKVERELHEGPISASKLIDAFRRMHAYKNVGLIGAEAEDLQLVDEEVTEFTDFLSSEVD